MLKAAENVAVATQDPRRRHKQILLRRAVTTLGGANNSMIRLFLQNELVCLYETIDRSTNVDPKEQAFLLRMLESPVASNPYVEPHSVAFKRQRRMHEEIVKLLRRAFRMVLREARPNRSYYVDSRALDAEFGAVDYGIIEKLEAPEFVDLTMHDVKEEMFGNDEETYGESYGVGNFGLTDYGKNIRRSN